MKVFSMSHKWLQFVLCGIIYLFAQENSLVNLKPILIKDIQNNPYQLIYRIENSDQDFSYYQFQVDSSIYKGLKAYEIPKTWRPYFLSQVSLQSGKTQVLEAVMNRDYIFTEADQLTAVLNQQKVKLKRVSRPVLVEFTTPNNKGFLTIEGDREVFQSNLPLQLTIDQPRNHLIYFNKNTVPSKIQLTKMPPYSTYSIPHQRIIEECPGLSVDTLQDSSFTGGDMKILTEIQNQYLTQEKALDSIISMIEASITRAYDLKVTPLQRVAVNQYKDRELKSNTCLQEFREKREMNQKVLNQVRFAIQLKALEFDNFRSRSGDEQFAILYEQFKLKNILVSFEFGGLFSLSESKYLEQASEVYSTSVSANYCFYVSRNHCLAPHVEYQFLTWYYDPALSDRSEEYQGRLGGSWYFPLLFRPGENTMMLSTKIDVFGAYSEQSIRSFNKRGKNYYSGGLSQSLILRWSHLPLGISTRWEYLSHQEFQFKLGGVWNFGDSL